MARGDGEIHGTGRGVWAWAFYDWANSTFATTVVAGFFPLFFEQYWSSGAGPGETTFRLGVGNAAASLVILILAPALGAVADRSGGKKTLLAAFALLGIVATGALYFVGGGQWQSALWLFVLASIGFSGSLIFYDALLVDVAPAPRVDQVSALGYALGYLGGGLLFALNVAMVLRPSMFGLPDAAVAVRLSFLSVAVWWALFSLPLLLQVHERRRMRPLPWLAAVGAGLRDLRHTFDAVRRLRMAFVFLIAYWLYIDGVGTIIRMAVDYGLSLGFDPNSLIVALLLTQFVGFPAAIGFGRLAGIIGAKRSIYLAILVYIGVTVWAYFLENERQFYAMAVAIGLVQGGLQSLSRSYFARLIPADRAGEFFGFYNMLGKFAAILGPLLVGWTALISGSARLSILAVVVLFGAGGILLLWVDEERGEAEARAVAEGTGQA